MEIIISIESYTWNQASNQWEANNTSIFTYDLNGKMTSFLNKYWLQQFGNWFNSHREFYTYNDLGLKTETNIESWDQTLQNWTLGGRITNNFNASGLIDTSVLQNYDKKSDEWTFTERTIYYYNPTTQISSINNKPFQLFPNPAQNFIQLQFESPNLAAIEIKDLLGKTVLKIDEFNCQTQLDISAILPNTYIIYLTHKEQKYIGKFIKCN